MTEVEIPPIRKFCGGCYSCFDPSWMSDPLQSGTDGIIVWTLYSFILIPLLLAFIAFSHVPSIKLRSPMLTTVGALSGFMVVTTVCAERLLRHTLSAFQFGYPRESSPIGVDAMLVVINNAVFLNVFLLSYPLRAVRLLYVFRKTVFASKQQQRSRSGTLAEDAMPMLPGGGAAVAGGAGGAKKKPMSVARHRRMRKSKFWRFVYSHIPRSWGDEGVITALLGLFGVALFLFAMFNDGMYSIGCVDIDSGVPMWIFVFVLYLLILTFLGISLYLLRNVKDEFTINNELRADCAIIVLFGVPWAAISLINAINGKRLPFPQGYLAVLMVVACNVVSIVMPLVQMVRPDKADILTSCKKMMKENTIGTTLESVLESEEATSFFAHYLETEFSSENLTFWDAIKFYKQKFDNTAEFGSATFVALAEAIFQQFLSEDGAMQINAPYEKVLAVRAFLDDASKHENFRDLKHLFDPLVLEVLQMMRLNSFPKFQESRFFREMIKKMHHSDLDALQQAGMLELETRGRADSNASSASAGSDSSRGRRGRRGRRTKKSAEEQQQQKKKTTPAVAAVVPVTVHPPVSRSQQAESTPAPAPAPATDDDEHPTTVVEAPEVKPAAAGDDAADATAVGTPHEDEGSAEPAKRKHKKKKKHKKKQHHKEAEEEEGTPPAIAPQDLEAGLKPVIESDQ